MKNSSNQSSLSKHGYDMVVAVTQKSVNDVMKRYMLDSEQKEYLLVLRRTLDPETEAYSFEAIDPIAEGIMAKIQMLLDTPAAKSERTAEQRINYQELYHDKISYVCKAQLGINPEAAENAPNIIQLEKSDIDSKFNATFNPIFKVFNLIYLHSEDDLILMQKEEQPKDTIWEFAYNIKLNYKKDIPYSKLPEQLKEDIRNSTLIEIPEQYSTLFDIRALYADFTSAMIQQYTPNIENNIQLKQFVQMFFEDYVLKDLREKGEDAIFSYSVKPETDILDKMKKSLVVPGAYKYYVSPYINESGKEQPEKKDLYTINYIVMEKDKAFPELKVLGWNWVDESEEKDKNGCMAVNSERLMESLTEDLKTVTEDACLRPKVELKDKFVLVDVKTCYDMDDFPENAVFEHDSKNPRLYRLVYEQSAKDGVYASGSLGIYVGLKITYKLEVTVEMKDNNQMEIVIRYEGSMDLQTGASHSNGRMAGNEHRCLLSINTDKDGHLTVSRSITTTPLDEDIDHNVFVDIFTVGTDRQCIESLTEFTNKISHNIGNRINTVFERIFDNTIHWVLPGNDTFDFKNPLFSVGNDLVVDLRYKEIK